MRLLGKPTSLNVRKVLWTGALIGAPLAPEPWGSGTERSCDEPEFLRLNPNGLVPVLVDGEEVLWESNTICRYLAARHGRSDLLPTDAMARAQVEKWMDWQAAELNPAWRYAFMGLVRHSPAFTDAAQIEASSANWNRLMALVDRQLESTGAYLAGQHFTLADVVVGLSTHRWQSTPLAHAHLPAMMAWFEQLAAQPGFAEYCANGVP